MDDSAIANGFGPAPLPVEQGLEADDTLAFELDGERHEDYGLLNVYFGGRGGVDGIRLVNESDEPLRLIGAGQSSPRVAPRTTGSLGVTDGSKPDASDPAFRRFEIRNIGSDEVGPEQISVEIMNGHRMPDQEPEYSFDLADLVPGITRRGP